MSDDIFAPWATETRNGWDQRAMRLAHRLHQHPALQIDALAGLIERYPRSHYALVMTTRKGQASTDAKRWREGELGGVPGRQVIDAIARGVMHGVTHEVTHEVTSERGHEVARQSALEITPEVTRGSLWLNLREVHLQGAAYQSLLHQAYAEITAQVPGFSANALKMGILISSPGTQVHYHCDLPGQLLWQIRGKKKVWLYPPTPPYLHAQWLEDIAYTGFEFSLVYDPAFDRTAIVFELEPGQMLTWPLNSPHRVENEDCMNISVTTEHWTPANRRAQKVHLANALLRHRLGWQPKGRALSGPAYWAKAALQAAWRRSPWAEATQRKLRPVDFRLAPAAPGGYVDLQPRA